ncbi:PAS domain S-box protein [Pigmentiphaga aceris]|uniref:histidine kinase n=1 Tax=Pigmentiphaga aceris TaxID=1940612 RepID=A0A5C0B289_9BURK|nr:hybrid sensor histidine kinase/response regulator [Pigmentiphaga aceris]QEI06717.1 PAS domain S-box protein [Pigmentiphaga aceris]
MPTHASAEHFLAVEGELPRLIAEFPWETTAAGPIAAWPVELKNCIGMLLRSPVPIVSLWYEDGVMIYNDAYSEFAGSRHPSLLGSKVREGWPEVADFNDTVMKVGLAGGTLSFQDQELVLHRDGRDGQAWMNLDYSPVIDAQGKPFGVIAIVIETTGKVRAEHARRTSEAQFRTLAEAMPNHVWWASPDGRMSWCNERYYAYTGATPGALPGDDWLQRVHDDDRQQVAALWQTSLATEQDFDAEFRLCRGDGHHRWHLARAVPQRHEDGSVARWIGTHTDIEDQKAGAWALARLNATLEEQVALRTADYDRIWRLSTDLMLVCQLDATIVAVNPAWNTVLGWDELHLVGRSTLSLTNPEDHEATRAEFARLSDGMTTMRFENRFQTQDGAYRTISWTAVPEQGMIHAVGRDVTTDLEAAAALRRTEVALQQAQKMETVGKLTGGVAHDFNNLLQVIAGNLQLLSRDVAGNERAERRVASALAGVSRGAKLASHLLAFGRRQVLEPRVVNIGRFLTGVEDMLRRTIGEAIDIETVASGGLWHTLVDPTQLENALLNLVINARDAMSGHGKLTVEVSNAFLDAVYAQDHTEVIPGQYVLLAVTDTGTGMPPEVLARVFEPFFSTKSEGKGSGLGLSMVFGFVKQSGGHVKLYSELGHGTTVKLYLPRTQQPEDIVALPDATPICGGSETILVAEDDEDVRATVVETLGELGYRVLRAKDASSALSIVEGGVSADLLFTDVVMPGPLRSPDLARRAKELLPETDLHLPRMSGRTLAGEARVRHPRIAVIVATGDSGVDGLPSGTRVMRKPYDGVALAAAVHEAIGTV